MHKYKLKYWLALAHAPKFGSAALQKLLEIFPDVEELFNTPWQQLIDRGIDPQFAAYLQKPDWAKVEKNLMWANDPHNHIFIWPDYPKLLKEISGGPVVLFARGDIELLSSPQLAIVGSRNPTPLGTTTAFEFAKQLSLTGFTITSGLALGIDAASHRGALAGTGKTIAVMGTGVDCIYPARHEELAQQILNQGGVLISEFFPGTTARPENFPQRNRIISGLSVGVLVVEAALRSGSIITAKAALDQGREVFAIPGSIQNPLSHGCHALIKQGAKLVETTADILEELGSLIQAIKPVKKAKPAKKAIIEDNLAAPTAEYSISLDKEQAKLVECIGYETTSVDTIVQRSGLAVEIVTSMLMLLEVEGYVTAVPGGYMQNVHLKKVMA
jgi:DNA processing protein